MGYSSKAIVCTENRFRQFTHFGTYLKPHYTQYYLLWEFEPIQVGEILLSFFPCTLQYITKKTNRKSFDVHVKIKCLEEQELCRSCAYFIRYSFQYSKCNFKNERKTCWTFIHNILNTTWTFPIAFSKTWYTQS